MSEFPHDAVALATDPALPDDDPYSASSSQVGGGLGSDFLSDFLCFLIRKGWVLSENEGVLLPPTED